jgi:hypothetical protein
MYSLLSATLTMPNDLVNRGVRGSDASTPLGSTIFIGLRALDPLLQRMILQSNPLSLQTGASSGGDLIRTAGLNLTPFQTVIWAMSVGSALKVCPLLRCACCNAPILDTCSYAQRTVRITSHGLGCSQIESMRSLWRTLGVLPIQVAPDFRASLSTHTFAYTF